MCAKFHKYRLKSLRNMPNYHKTNKNDKTEVTISP
jgi:hypothetical protein